MGTSVESYRETDHLVLQKYDIIPVGTVNSIELIVSVGLNTFFRRVLRVPLIEPLDTKH